jgi:hypothetical protein
MMILIMKINFINIYIYINVHHINIEMFKNNLSYKNISLIFKYLNFIFQIVTNCQVQFKYLQIIFLNMFITI